MLASSIVILVLAISSSAKTAMRCWSTGIYANIKRSSDSQLVSMEDRYAPHELRDTSIYADIRSPGYLAIHVGRAAQVSAEAP